MNYNYVKWEDVELKIGVYSLYFNNSNTIYKDYQKKIFDKFNIKLNQIAGYDEFGFDGHANFMNDIMNQEEVDYYIFFDIDAFPMVSNFFNIVLERIYNTDTILGIEQRANHLNEFIYAGPACFCVSKKFYEKLGRPKFNATYRSDVAGELSHICVEKNHPITFFKFNECEIELWNLNDKVKFGIGSNYENIIYHNFLSLSSHSVDIFIKNADKILKSYV
jgi:hypothetical protein